MAELGETLRALDAAFRELDLSWFVFGAQAAIHYGVSRTTNDLDITLEPGSTSTRTIADALVEEGFRLRFDDPDFVSRTRVLPVVHRSGMPVDVVLGGSYFEQLFLSRAEKRRIDGAKVPVALPEDIVVMKILAGRDKDRADIGPILRSRRTNVDPEKVRETLRLLEGALDQSDLLPEFERLLAAARRG